MTAVIAMMLSRTFLLMSSGNKLSGQRMAANFSAKVPAIFFSILIAPSFSILMLFGSCFWS